MLTPRISRAALRTCVAVALITALVASTVPSQGLGRAGPRNNRGFPTYYTDNRGLALRLCVDGTARCHGATRADLLPPDGEALYWAAAATIHSKRGPLDVEFALEAAFSDAGRPIVFDRIRIRGHLGRAGAYILGHPYGRNRFRAINPREQQNVNVTQDRQCHLRRRARCGGLIDNFLRARFAPKGYIGAGEQLRRVRGGTVRNSLVLRTGNGRVIGRTAKFEVIGKRAGRLAR